LDFSFCGFAENVWAATDSGHNYVVRSVKWANKANNKRDKNQAVGTTNNQDSLHTSILTPEGRSVGSQLVKNPHL